MGEGERKAGDRKQKWGPKGCGGARTGSRPNSGGTHGVQFLDPPGTAPPLWTLKGWGPAASQILPSRRS